MEIIFADSGYTLTTEHPASHYQLGVLISPEGRVYTPSQQLPILEHVKAYFPEAEPMLAGELVMIESKKHVYSEVQIALLRRYLSQDPQKRWALPDNKDLWAMQAQERLRVVMGDVSQGVNEVWWREGRAKVAAEIYKASSGQYTCDDTLAIVPASLVSPGYSGFEHHGISVVKRCKGVGKPRLSK